MVDTHLAFRECFARIDKEFLQKAEDEVCDAIPSALDLTALTL